MVLCIMLLGTGQVSEELRRKYFGEMVLEQ